jgi:hypothetical protein
VLALLISIYVPVLVLLWGFSYLALRWLRTGRPAPRWTLRRIRSRADAYWIAANAGLVTALFFTMPTSPWLRWFKTTSLARSPVLYFGPLVLFPACFLALAAISDRAGRRQTTADANNRDGITRH